MCLSQTRKILSFLHFHQSHTGDPLQAFDTGADVPVNDLVVVPAPSLQAVIFSWRDVAYDVYLGREHKRDRGYWPAI